ncbi:MAG TPA: glycosyltransferase family 39 protein [Candidatus Dormibacteraeota bacterium]
MIIHITPPTGAAYAGEPLGLDPNHEHPPLGKLFIAESMRRFGDNGLGWRLPSIIAGMLCILLLYLLVLAAGGDRWLALLATTLFSFDNLVLVHSRIGVLDIFLLAFMLLAAWGALKDWPWLAGLGAGLATLIKLNGTYAVAAILVFYAVMGLVQWRRDRRFPQRQLVAAGIMLAVFAPVFIGGLWVLDHAVTKYANPIDHVQFMTKYGFSLRRPGGPANSESYPWQWLINEVQIPYLRVDQTLIAGTDRLTRATIFFRGAMNPFLIGAFPLGFAYASWRAWYLQDRLSIFVLAWILGCYVPFYLLSFVGERISYIFYFLPTMPAVAISIAQLLRHDGVPRVVMWVFLVGVLGGFIGYFPFRALV